MDIGQIFASLYLHPIITFMAKTYFCSFVASDLYWPTNTIVAWCSKCCKHAGWPIQVSSDQRPEVCFCTNNALSMPLQGGLLIVFNALDIWVTLQTDCYLWYHWCILFQRPSKNWHKCWYSKNPARCSSNELIRIIHTYVFEHKGKKS